jgi:hypothetical protein
VLERDDAVGGLLDDAIDEGEVHGGEG